MTRGGTARIRIAIRGAVQGVGFRPFVFRLAADLRLNGWVVNSSQGVFIEAEAEKETLDTFMLRLSAEKPALARIQSLEFSFLDPVGYTAFEIRESREEGGKTVLVLPDIATCAECLAEVRDPGDRRYRYPFTNCTNCGPRLTIIESLPYDRPRTSMKGFALCADCEREYREPSDRRFHAQPVACPLCGPRVELWAAGDRASNDPEMLAVGDDAIRKAARAVGEGRILALKGIGGFLFIVDAGDAAAVNRLRERKPRREKPFALMFPSLDSIKAHCEVSAFEERLLRSPECPILIVRKKRGKGADDSSRGDRAGQAVCDEVAPGNPYLGVMLPYSPLHHLLMEALGKPVVATSGNLTDEPICTNENEAVRRFAGIADLFLVHNRPIVRHADDSIVRVILGRELVVRRARGYAPLPVHLKDDLPPLLAVGGHLKNTIAVSIGRNVFISQHLGDLETAESVSAFERTIRDFHALYEVRPQGVACDLHPDYYSTRWARKWADENGLPLVQVQHHYAHILSAMAENELDGEVLGVSWDGTGYGLDSTVWGGEFLACSREGFRRLAHLRTFRLPGGDRAIIEPRRVALGLLYELLGHAAFERDDLAPVRAFSDSELRVILRMLERGINAPVTSSAGRLFDAVAAIVDIRQRMTFEGQAAMALEFAAGEVGNEPYPFAVVDGAAGVGSAAEMGHPERAVIVDWGPMIEAILRDIGAGEQVSRLSARFHETLAHMIQEVARRAAIPRVVLSGGCFQNARLTERVSEVLTGAGFAVYTHQRVPPNDGGIALGQIVAAARRVNR
jgi:hydrogenase maturation protein HypF